MTLTHVPVHHSFRSPYHSFLFFSPTFPAMDAGEAGCLQWRCCLPIKGNSGKLGSMLLSFQFRLPNFFLVFSRETFTGTIWLICSKFNTHRAYWSYRTCTDHLCGGYWVCLRPWTPWVSCKVHVYMNNEHYSEIPGGLAAHSDSLLWLCCPIFLRRKPQMQVYICCIIWQFSVLPPGNSSETLLSSVKTFFLDFCVLPMSHNILLFLSVSGWQLLLTLL